MIRKIGLVLLLTFVLAGCNQNPVANVSLPPFPGSELAENQTETSIYDWKDALTIQFLPEEYKRLTVPYLRQQSFPGSEIQRGREVSETSTYTSYLASYESEGNTINGLLTIPKTAEPEGGYPAIVFVHGYIPPAQYETTERYVSYVDALAREGFVVFKIDLRGHGDSEGQPGGGYYSADYIYDVLNARASLAQLDEVNPDKIGLWGHSMAGNVTLRATAVKPEIPATVIWAGAVYTYTDQREYGINDNSYQPSQNPNRNRRQELYNTVGEISPENQFWKQVAPTSYINEFQGKISVHHAANDSVVPVEYSRNLDELFSAAGKDLEFYEYPSGGHDIEGASFGTAMRRTIDTYKSM